MSNLQCSLIGTLLASMVSWSVLAIDDPAPTNQKKEIPSVLNFTMKTIDGSEKNLADYQGQAILIVNVASQCGYTPQYKELQSVYETYKDRGFTILAFPANNFGSQEPGTNEEIKKFCTSNFKVTFDLFAKVSVKGDDCCDLYKYLSDAQKNGVYGGEIKWNFTKFLVDRSGNVIGRFEPKVKPDDPQLIAAIEKALTSESTGKPVSPKS